jgi:hydroxymethylbilane synthase
MLPAVAQGAIGLTCRAGDRSVRDLLAALDHPETTTRVTAERAMLEVLDGSCRTPIAALAEVDGRGGLTLSGLIARPDGSELLETARAGRTEDARSVGRDAGEELRRRAGPGFFEDIA